MKMSKKEKIAYLLVAIACLIITFAFLKIFAFEDKNKNYPKVDNDLLNELYNYIPNYHNYYYKLGNLTNIEITNTIIKYIENNESDLIQDNSLKIQDFELIGKKIFGQEIKFNHQDYLIDNYELIYNEEQSSYTLNKLNEANSYIEKREYDKYTILDDGKTIIIYDRYVLCDKENNCYKDYERNYQYSFNFLKDGTIDLKNNLTKAASYKHTFKYEDNHYIWYSSELAD